MKLEQIIFANILVVAIAASVVAEDLKSPAIIPVPQKMEIGSGSFRLSSGTRVLADSASRETGIHLSERLRQATGYPLQVRREFPAGALPKDCISLTVANVQVYL